MRNWIVALCLLPISALALPTVEKGDFKMEISGNIEGQSRHLWNQSSSHASPLSQHWDESSFNMAMANLHLRTEFKESRIEANWFGRYAQSPLYKDNYLAPQLLNFPRKLVARDVFGLAQSDQNGDNQTDSVLNKFFYELDGEDSRFSIGRLYINYGAGETFNPINPFNQPLGLVSQSNVAQGNDGMKASIFLTENATINFYLLGDKRLEDYENQITRTLWMHGEYRSGDWQFDYVIGEDQKRNKLGGQVNYIWGDAMVFAQLLHSTAYINGKSSEQLYDALLGYDHQFTGKWHFRLEFGYQEKDEKLTANNPAALGERFLPFEKFVAVAQTYEIHPLVKLSATIAQDFKTHFLYGMGRASWSIFNDVEWDLFVNSPLYWEEDQKNYVEKLIPTEVGTALRMFF